MSKKRSKKTSARKAPAAGNVAFNVTMKPAFRDFIDVMVDRLGYSGYSELFRSLVRAEAARQGINLELRGARR